MTEGAPTASSEWVVVTAYNEARVLSQVIAGIVQVGYNVVVVDDHSRDATAARAAAAGAYVLRHPVNLGQGAALQTGIDFALGHDAEFIVTFDGDGQHLPEEIPHLVKALKIQQVDFALGSRFLGTTQNLPRSRRGLLRWATRFTRVTTGLRVTDAHNGLRAMTRRGACAINLRQNRMAHASEILHQIARSKLPYIEVPVTIVYTPYSIEKGQKISDSVSILVDLFARSLQR